MTDTLPSLSSSAPIPLDRPADPLIGTKLNGFVITGTVSVGGMGVVYAAKHPVIGRRAAVKVIRPELDKHADMSARFLREARAVSAVKHRNVVDILDYGALPDGSQYMLMEFLEGETLAEVITRRAPLGAGEALSICEEILSGLSAAHQVGVVHRDLKPANIVMQRQSTGELLVKLLDFGLARQGDVAPEPTRESLRELALEKASCLAGTPEYISPEQASGAQVGPQADLYGVGVILYELLTGTLPFNAMSPWELLKQHRFAAPPMLTAIVPTLDRRVEAFVLRLLAKDPADRPLGAQEATRALTQLRAVLSLRNRRAPSLRFVALAGLVTAVGAAVFAVAQPTPAAAASAEMTVVAALEPDEPLSPPPPPPAWEPPTALVPRPVLVSAAHLPARPAPSTQCAPTQGWRRSAREQVEDLAKLALSKMKEDAPVDDVVRVKQRARTLASAVRDGACDRVEASLKSWRAELR